MARRAATKMTQAARLAKLVATLPDRGLLHAELEALGARLGGELHVLLLVKAEVVLEDADRLFVHVLVGVVLQLLELVETLSLVDERGVRVGLHAHRDVVARLEHVLDAFERHGDEPRVVAREQVAERLDAALLDEVLDLVRRASRGGVANRPRGLLLNVELSIRKQVDKRWDDVGLDDSLRVRARRLVERGAAGE